MRKMTLSRKFFTAGSGVVALAAATLMTTGCGTTATQLAAAPTTVSGVAVHGSVHGGQQPVTGSSIQLYAASTGGYGSASYALLQTPVTTDGGGSFNITGDYTCPSASSQVYLVATGGNPGAGVNSAVAAMAALGSCGNLSYVPFISMNEITTVASVFSLAPFMSGYASVGTSAGNVQGLMNAFSTVNKLANYANGSSAGTLPAGATAPASEINTLANIIAACINTAGPSSYGCTTLFAKSTPPGGTAATDTIGAALNIAKNPGNNVSDLLMLNSPSAPFQPSLATINDYTVAIKYKPTASKPSSLAINAAGDVWVTNSGNNTISKLDATTSAATIYTGGGLNAPSALAFDQSGNAWVTNKASNTVSVFSAAGSGAVSGISATLLSSPSDIAIDGNNQLWIANAGSNALTYVTINGNAAVTANNVTGGGVNAAVAVAINPY